MPEPQVKTEDDRANLDDVTGAIQALEEAQDALLAAMTGKGPAEREKFVFKVGFARGRLSRVSSRIYGGLNAA
jgi:hypothetical protein